MEPERDLMRKRLKKILGPLALVPALFALAGQGSPSVILLRVEGLSAEEQEDLIEYICRHCQAALAEGAPISADGIAARIRRLPLR